MGEDHARRGQLAPVAHLEAGTEHVLDAEIQRRVFTLLTAQYEDMRVQETRDTPTLTVLDRAHRPEIRSSPKRGLMVMTATGLAALLAAAWIVFQVRRPAGA